MNTVEKKLAELIREHPNLYDQSRQDYKDALKGHLSWKEIAGVMGKSEEELKMKWKNLRDKYCKAKKRMTKRSSDRRLADSEENHVDRPVPALLHQLDWLNAFVKPRVESGGMTSSEVTESGDDLENVQDKEKKEQHLPLPLISTSFSLLESCPNNQQEIKRKRQAATEPEISPVDAHTSIRDEDELFLLSLLPSLKRLTIKKRMEVRMKFQQVLYTAEFED
uniref:uncharacterized protein LOC122772864 isoform X2 n=1 Tax=Solea senegalensis TaxID=28829 RepID=UPI001CD84609|nr:uncharacterized protein LOC122772864 isoform X2 [Solea senegalensis]